MYNFVSPLDSSMPTAPSIAIQKGETQQFTAVVPTPTTHGLTISWAVDGNLTAFGTSFLMQTVAHGVGNHSVTVTVHDGTSFVRNDPSLLLTASRTWTVAVSGFTDALVPGNTPVKAVHITELRTRINAVRTSKCGLEPFAFADPTLTAGVTMIRSVHVLELRTALNQAYVSCGLRPPPFTDSLESGTLIKAVHLSELRGAVVAIE